MEFKAAVAQTFGYRKTDAIGRCVLPHIAHNETAGGT